jgi:hypothetical protein
MALPLAVEAALAPDEVRRAPIVPGLRLRESNPCAFWMQSCTALVPSWPRSSDP